MQTKYKFIFTGLVAAILVGCASVRAELRREQSLPDQEGRNHRSRLDSDVGEPQNRTLNSEGQSILTWIYSESAVKGESFIPYAGPFVGGTRSKTKTLNVTLQDGKVVSFASTGGGMESAARLRTCRGSEPPIRIKEQTARMVIGVNQSC
jgi:hypothetical protein